MRLQKIKITNYKNIKSLEKDLNGNIYVVKGDNEVGKTTFAKSFQKLIAKTDKADKPVTVGETHGTIEGIFTDAEGKKYTVILDFTDEKETIRMITPEGISTSKVGDIRNMFAYTNIDFEEFISWSNTADGKRKQREIVLGLLSEKDLEEFRNLEKIEKTNYDKRTVVNNNLQAHKNLASQVVTDDEKLLIKEYDENLKEIEKLQHCEVNLKELEHLETELTRLENHATTLKENYERRIQEKKDAIIKLNAEIVEYGVDRDDALKTNATAISSIKDHIGEIESILPEGKPDEMRAEAEVNKTKYADIPTFKARIVASQQNTNQITGLTQESSEFTLNINSIRDNKKKIIAEANLGIDGLDIGEDEILLKGLPFTKEQLSTSQIITTVFKIMASLNKQTPIFHLGRAESLGKTKLDEILKIANDNEYQVFIDKVASGEKLEIELYEEFDNNQQTLL